MNARTIKSGLALAGLGLLLTGLSVSDAHAQKRIEFLNGGKGVRSLAAPQGAQRGKVVQIHGKLSYDHRTGFTIAKKPLLLTATTSVYPIPAGQQGAMLDPRRVGGRTATVFGRQTPQGIVAVLMIFNDDNAKDSSSLLGIAEGVDERQFAIPSSEDPDVGEFTAGVPE